MTVLASLHLHAGGEGAGAVPGTAGQLQVPQAGRQRGALGIGRQEAADINWCGVLVNSLLEKRNGPVCVEHFESVPLASCEVSVEEEGGKAGVQVEDVVPAGLQTPRGDVAQERCEERPHTPVSLHCEAGAEEERGHDSRDTSGSHLTTERERDVTR